MSENILIVNMFKALRTMAKQSPNCEIKAEDGINNLKVICIPDIIDRFQWFSDNIPISESYARILMERAVENGTNCEA